MAGWEWDKNLLRRGVRICHCQCRDCNNQGGSLGPWQQHTQSSAFRISFTLWFSLYILKFMYTWGRADMLRWVKHDRLNSFLGSNEKNQTFLCSSCYSTHTKKHIHTHTPSKSLARMTGDGQKQIMVIDRCLEMDLCVCVCLLVCQRKRWGLGAVCKSYWFCPVGRLCR